MKNLVHAVMDAFYMVGSTMEIPGEIRMRMIRGPLFQFHVAYSPGLTGWELEKMLRLYGVRLCARFVHPETKVISFKVAKAQSNWAEYVMRRWRIPLCGPVVNPRNLKAMEHWRPLVPWGRGLPVNDFVGVLCVVLDTLFGARGLQVAGMAPGMKQGWLARIARAVDVVLDAIAQKFSGDSIRRAWEEA